MNFRLSRVSHTVTGDSQNIKEKSDWKKSNGKTIRVIWIGCPLMTAIFIQDVHQLLSRATGLCFYGIFYVP